MNRIELLKLMPANSICAEIGVCEGEYSQHIVGIAKPSRLFLVDVWGHISLSYHDHNMVDHSTHEKRFQMVAKKFHDYPNVYLLRTLSTSLENIFPEKFFDWMYIDADHSYEGCKKDLEIADKLVKDDGYILGHDYCGKFSGVVTATDQFVKNNNYILSIVTRDKNSTYCISKNQESHNKLFRDSNA